MVFDNSSKWLKIAAVVLLVANVVNLIAFATNGWAQTQEKNTTTSAYTDFGLWQACKCDCVAPEQSGKLFSNNFEPFYRATQAMMSLGFAMLVIVLLLVIVSMVIFVLQRTIIIKFVITGLCVAAVIFIFIGVTVYGARMTQEINGSDAVNGNLYYSYGLSVVTAILALVATILSVMDMRTQPE